MKFKMYSLLMLFFVAFVGTASANETSDVANTILSEDQKVYFNTYLGEKVVEKLNGNFSQSYVDSVNEYHAEVKDLKLNINEMLKQLHGELASKKYPQEFFIKSIMSQVEDKKFNSANDFDVTKQILSELQQSIDSQAKANKKLDQIILSNSDYLLNKLEILKENYKTIAIPQGLNEITAKKNQVRKKSQEISGASWLSMESLTTAAITLGTFLVGVTSAIVKNIISHQTFILLTGGIVSFVALVYLSFRTWALSGENKKLKNKNWNNLVAVKAKKDLRSTLDSLSELSICQVDSKDKIVFSNKSFEKKFGKHPSWPTFFSENFKLDKSLKGASEFYKYKNDITNDYFISVGERDPHGMRMIFIHHLNSLMLTRLAESRKSILEENKLNVLDLLENSISKQGSFRNEGTIRFAETDYAESLSLYLSEDVGQKLVDHFVKAVSSVVRIKGCSKEVEVKPVRTDRKLQLIAFIPDVALNSKDLTSTIPFGGKMITLGKALKSVGNLAEGHEVSFVVKNIESNVRRGTQIELVISDLDKVNINTFEYTV